MIHSLKVYQNAAKLFDKSTNESPHIDLTFNENGEVVNWKKGLTSCVRFNYKKNPLRDILWIGLTLEYWCFHCSRECSQFQTL